MKTLAKISDFAGKYMAIIALAVAIIALVFPAPVSAVVKTSYVNILLGIVMFGMGMTLKLADFKVVFTKPRPSSWASWLSSSSCRCWRFC